MRNLMLSAVLCLALPATAGAQSISHGRYLVERVGGCNDCHTPRDQQGQLIMAKELQGALLGVQPIHPMPRADTAPPIAGLPPHYTPEQMAKFLETGIKPDGTTPKPPMPPYRFTHDDAVAVTAYIRTLPKP